MKTQIQRDIVKAPTLSQFLFTVIYRPVIPDIAMLAGEIELYIYDAIYRGMQHDQ